MSGSVSSVPIETDALIVGAGPVGLFQVFQLGLLEIRAQVVDSLPVVGGQCAELYPDKPIYDIPGLPMCTGRELVDRLMRQIGPFDAGFHLDQEVATVERHRDGRFGIATSAGTRFLARALVIAGGVGSFQPRRLKIDGIDAFERRQLFYRFDDAARFEGLDVLVIGDDDAGLQAALSLVERGADARGARARTTLMHRRDGFRASAEVVARVAAARADGRLDFIAAQPVGFDAPEGRLRSLRLALPDASTRELAVDAVLALTGLSPKLGPIADWGLKLEKKQLVVDTEKFQTDVPGIFAVGDVNTYPGKKKLILCGFHEATLAAHGVAAQVFPERPARLEYTTTSPRLHRLLGVEAGTGQAPASDA